MNIRRKLTTAALTGVLLVSGAGAAFAGTTPTDPAPTPPPAPGPYWVMPPIWVFPPIWGPGPWHPGHPAPVVPPAPVNPGKCVVTDQGTWVCKKGCFVQNKKGKFVPVDCPCTEWQRDKKGNKTLVEVDCPKDCPTKGDKCTEHGKGGHNRPAKGRPAPANRARKHPVTGSAAALYAVGGGLLAATGGTLLVTQKRRNADNA